MQAGLKKLSAGWAIWGFAALLYLVAMFHRTALGVAAFDAEHRFGVGAGVVATFVAVQLVVYLALQIPVGLAADRIGARRSLAVGTAAIAAGEMLFALSGGLGAGLAGRALVGMGDACIFVNALRLAHAWFPPHRAAQLTALTSMIGAVGQLVSTVPLHIALDRLGWVTTFGGAAAATGLLSAAALRLVRDEPAGAAARVPAHDRVRSTLNAAWRVPGTRMGFWTHFGLMGPFVSTTALWGHPWLVEGHGVAPDTAAAWLAVGVACFAAAAPVVGYIGSRGSRAQLRVAVGSGLLVVVAWTSSLAWPLGDVPDALLIATLAVTGVGGAASMVAFMLARAANLPQVAGSALGLVNCGGFVAAAVVVLAAGVVLGAVGHGATGYRLALTPMLAGSAFALFQTSRLMRADARHTTRCAPERRPLGRRPARADA
jgi:MFS family permease